MTIQEAIYQRRLARYQETGDPCDRDAAEAVNPRRYDPAWTGVDPDVGYDGDPFGKRAKEEAMRWENQHERQAETSR